MKILIKYIYIYIFVKPANYFLTSIIMFIEMIYIVKIFFSKVSKYAAHPIL